MQIDSAGCSPRLTQHTLERVHFAGKSLEYAAHENPECREEEEERREMREMVCISPANEASIYRGKEAVTQPLKWRELRQKIWALRARMMQKI